MRSIIAIAITTVVIGAAAAVGGCATPEPEPVVLEHHFPDVTLAAGQERADLCQSWTLGNADPVAVNTVELTAGLGWHHSNWYFVPEREYRGPDGVWDCAERSFDGATAALAGGVLFAQSTQVTTEVQQLPAGAVIELPRHARVVGETHGLNASPDPVTTSLSLTLQALPADQVTIRLRGLALEYLPLDLPPHARSTFAIDCDLGDAHRRLLGRPVDFAFYHVLGHYHGLGVGARVVASGDGIEPEVVFETAATIGHVASATLDPPYPMAGKSRLHFECTFDNPRAERVGWGIGDQEMCMLFAFTDSELTWGGGNVMDNQVVGVAADGTVLNQGPCTVIAVAAGG